MLMIDMDSSLSCWIHDLRTPREGRRLWVSFGYAHSFTNLGLQHMYDLYDRNGVIDQHAFYSILMARKMLHESGTLPKGMRLSRIKNRHVALMYCYTK